MCLPFHSIVYSLASLSLQRSPVRNVQMRALLNPLLHCVCGSHDKNTRRKRAARFDPVFLSNYFANFDNGDKPALRDPFHDLYDIAWIDKDNGIACLSAPLVPSLLV